MSADRTENTEYKMVGRKRHCGECPFRKNALRGYLGPYQNQVELHRQVMDGEYFACHKSHPHKDANFQDIKDGKLALCAGSLAYMKINGKLPVDPELRALRNNIPQEVIDNTLSAPEFMKHHDQEQIRKDLMSMQAETRELSSVIGNIEIEYQANGVRSSEEIKRQVEGLRAMRANLPETSYFGDNNWESIDAQIDILMGNANSDEFDEDPDSGEEPSKTYFDAVEAEEWLKYPNHEDLFEI